MKRLIFILFTVFAFTISAVAKVDTLYVSHLFTSHVIFSTDVTYADMSNSRVIGVRIVEQNKNMIAIKARAPFDEACSVSALESNGNMHTFIVVYLENPSNLIVDMRGNDAQKTVASNEPSVMVLPKGTLPSRSVVEELVHSSSSESESSNVSTWKTGSAPLLSDIIKVPQHLYHIYCKEYDIEALCEDISSYSDITYFVISVRNGSGISYEVKDATFVIENKKTGKRSVKFEKTQFPRSRYGKLSVGPGEYKRVAYSFDKMTLAKDQVLKIYLYEEGGQRHLLMEVNPKDLNRARRSV